MSRDRVSGQRSSTSVGAIFDKRSALRGLCSGRGGIQAGMKRLRETWEEHSVPVELRRGRATLYRRMADTLEQQIADPSLLDIPFLLESYAHGVFRGEISKKVALAEFKLRAAMAGSGDPKSALFGLELADDLLKDTAFDPSRRTHRLAKASLTLHCSLYRASVPGRLQTDRAEWARRGVATATAVEQDIRAIFSEGDDFRNGECIFAAKIAVNFLNAEEIATGVLSDQSRAPKLVLDHHVWRGIIAISEWIGDPRLLVNSAEGAACYGKHELAADALHRAKEIAGYSGKIREWSPTWIPPTHDGRPYFQTIPALQRAIDILDGTDTEDHEHA